MGPRSEFIKGLHEKLRAAFPSKWSEETDRLVVEWLQSKFDCIGPERIARAINAALEFESGAFQIEKIVRHIPPAHIQGKRCGQCQNSDGWLHAKSISGINAMTRCKHDGRTIRGRLSNTSDSTLGGGFDKPSGCDEIFLFNAERGLENE